MDQIVRAHGGSIEVSSTAEEGTSFRVLLPREVPLHSTASAASRMKVRRLVGSEFHLWSRIDDLVPILLLLALRWHTRALPYRADVLVIPLRHDRDVIASLVGFVLGARAFVGRDGLTLVDGILGKVQAPLHLAKRIIEVREFIPLMIPLQLTADDGLLVTVGIARAHRRAEQREARPSAARC
ncbi:hypothetical protein F0U61_10725 [Archangium violaceum]|nr:hypothetical protein F0U61_10725 [Archangium violaceum]